MAHTCDGVILFQINSDCVWTIDIVACLYTQVYAVAMVYSTRPKTPCRLKEFLANTALLSVIALVVLLFSLPTIVFLAFRGSDMSSRQESFSILSSFLDTCGSQSVRNSVSSSWQTALLEPSVPALPLLAPSLPCPPSLSSLPFLPPSPPSFFSVSPPSFFSHPPFLPQSNVSMSPGCTALPSTSTCYTHIKDLLESQVTSNNLSLMVSPRGDMNELQDLENLLSNSQNLLTQRCRSTGLPLYCKFLFPPCFNGRVDPTLQLTHSQCTSLVDDVCQAEVTLIMPYLGYLRDRVSNLIPNCGTLQEDNTEVCTYSSQWLTVPQFK